MNLDAVFIFNLSSPEKLQLVEDLWDDLAATPSEVPVHEWQKEELSRPKVVKSIEQIVKERNQKREDRKRRKAESKSLKQPDMDEIPF